MRVRVYLCRRASRASSEAARAIFVERDVNWNYWRHVLGTYRDLRRDGASPATARALIKFTLEAVS